MNKLIRQQIETINMVLTTIEDCYDIFAKKYNLNYNSLMVFYVLDAEVECTQKFICEQWKLPKQTVHTILMNLKNKGYIDFKASDINKKEKIVYMTKQGMDYAKPLLAEIYNLEERAMLSIGKKSCEQMVLTNVQYCNAFEKEVKGE